MSEKKAITSRGLLLALALGALPWLVSLADFPKASELPDVQMDEPLDLPLAAAGLLFFVLAACFLRLPRFLERLGRTPVVLLLALAALPAVLGSVLLPTALTNDERAYVFEAELLARGEMSMPLPPAYLALDRRQVLDDVDRGLRYSKYPPGTSAALVPGVMFGYPEAMLALAGILDVLLVIALARRMGCTEPRLAGLLFVLSPFFLLTQTSFQSEVFTLPAALAGYLAVLRAREETSRSGLWGLFAGACAGWIFLTRPLTGVLFALAAALGLLWQPRGRRARGLGSVGAAVIGGLPFLGLTLWFNATLTGDALQTPYDLYAQRYMPWDVYPFFLSDFCRNPFEAFFQTLIRQTAPWSRTLFGVLGAFGLGVWGLWRQRRLDGGAGFAFVLLVPLAYALHWHPGQRAYLGPLHSYESLGLLVVGALVLLRSCPESWRRALPLAAILAGLALTVSRWPMMIDQALVRSAPQRLAAELGIEPNAVVLYNWDEKNPQKGPYKYYTPSDYPLPEGIVYIRQLNTPAHDRQNLRILGLGGRPVYRFVRLLQEPGGKFVPYDP